MNILIIHCWGCDCESNWFPWLKEELEARSLKVVCPNFPNSENPKLNEWLAEIRKHVKKFDEDWILVGHSLGCPTILRLFETFDEKEKIKAAILVAGFAKDLDIPQIRNFVDKEFNWNKIKTKSSKFVVINSDDDPYIDIEEGQRIARLLGTTLIKEHHLGHIKGGPDGRYQHALEIILSIASDSSS